MTTTRTLFSPCLYKASAWHFVEFFQQSLAQQGLSEAELDLIRQQRHPDVSLLWSEDIRVNDLREVQQHLYRRPTRLSQRYLVILQADKLRSSYAQFLLKLLEDLPDYLQVYLTALDFGQVLPTVASRLFRGYFQEPDEAFQRLLLERQSLTDIDLRIQLSCSQVDVAAGLDMDLLRPWYEDWSSVLERRLFPVGELYHFFSRFRSISRDTWYALWNTFPVIWAASVYRRDYLKPAIRAIQMKSQSYNRLTFETTMVDIYSDYSLALRRG